VSYSGINASSKFDQLSEVPDIALPQTSKFHPSLKRRVAPNIMLTKGFSRQYFVNLESEVVSMGSVSTRDDSELTGGRVGFEF
jgi:hypothetical protein